MSNGLDSIKEAVPAEGHRPVSQKQNEAQTIAWIVEMTLQVDAGQWVWQGCAVVG